MIFKKGKIINIKDLYLFQPVELENEMASLYDHKRPVNLNKTHLKKFLTHKYKKIKMT